MPLHLLKEVTMSITDLKYENEDIGRAIPFANR